MDINDQKCLHESIWKDRTTCCKVWNAWRPLSAGTEPEANPSWSPCFKHTYPQKRETCLCAGRTCSDTCPINWRTWDNTKPIQVLEMKSATCAGTQSASTIVTWDQRAIGITCLGGNVTEQSDVGSKNKEKTDILSGRESTRSKRAPFTEMVACIAHQKNASSWLETSKMMVAEEVTSVIIFLDQRKHDCI